MVKRHQKIAVLTLYGLTISFGFIAVALIGMQGIWAFCAIVITNKSVTIQWAKRSGLFDFFKNLRLNEEK